MALFICFERRVHLGRVTCRHERKSDFRSPSDGYEQLGTVKAVVVRVLQSDAGYAPTVLS